MFGDLDSLLDTTMVVHCEMEYASNDFIKYVSSVIPEVTPTTSEEAHLRTAGVLVPLFRKHGEWSMLLCLRSSNLAEHSREIAFPGGRMESGDVDVLSCALREAEEEVGIRPADVSVIGRLRRVVTRTGYTIHPVIGTLPDDYHFIANDGEVAELLEVPLVWLMDRKSVRNEAFLQPSGSIDLRRTYAFGSHLIFGATGRIITDFLDSCPKLGREASRVSVK